MIYKELLLNLTEMSREVLGGNLVGVYLHGSAAMGCFNDNKSDLDIILVVKDDIADEVKLNFMDNIVQFNQEAPPKGLELSIVKKTYCNPFVYPTPFELHFSNAHLDWFKQNPENYIGNMKGTDKDLAAHFTIIKKFGIVLYGQDINEIFGDVDREYYIESIWSDIENADEDILIEPVYIILNLCRVLAYIKESLILSKEEGGKWGLNNLSDKYYNMIHDALFSYTTDKDMEIQSETTALGFAEYMINEIKKVRT